MKTYYILSLFLFFVSFGTIAQTKTENVEQTTAGYSKYMEIEPISFKPTKGNKMELRKQPNRINPVERNPATAPISKESTTTEQVAKKD